MKELNFKQVQHVNEILQNIDAQSLASNPQECHTTAIWCATQRAFTGEQMAIAKKDWQDKKVSAYQNFILSNEANKARVDKFGVMVVKDYINAKCGDYEARYEYVERTNNALGSMEDVLRSVISALKQEMYSSQHD
jgi:glutaredoxin 2